ASSSAVASAASSSIASCGESSSGGRGIIRGFSPVPSDLSSGADAGPSGPHGHLALGVRACRFAQHIAAAPDGLDVVFAAGRLGKLLAQLADEDVDDLQLRLIHAAIEMVEEHLLGQGRAFAQAE